MKKTYLLFSFLLMFVSIFAQTETYSKVYFDQYNDVAAFDLVEIDSAFYIVGYDNQDAVLIYADALGNLQWVKSYTTGNNSVFTNIICTSDSFLLLAGQADGIPLVMKANLQGDTLWTRSINIISDAYIYDILELPDSSYIVSGCNSWNEYNCQAFIAELSKNGNLVWSKVYSIAGSGITGLSIDLCNDSTLIAAGACTGNPDTTLVMKLDLSGDTLWTKGYSIANPSYSRAVGILHEDSEFVFVSSMGGDYVITSIDSSGSVLWAKKICMDPNYSSFGMFISKLKLNKTRSGKYLFTPENDLFTWGGFLSVFDPNTKTQLTGEVFAFSTNAIQCSDDNLVLLGDGPLQLVKTSKAFPYEFHVGLYKCDSVGAGSDCVSNLQNKNPDTALVSEVRSHLNIQSIGSVLSISPVINLLTLTQLDRCVGGVGAIEKEDAYKMTVSPNPSNGSFVLKFNHHIESQCCIVEISNFTGKCLFSKSMAVSGNELFVDAIGLSPGIYFVVVENNNERMISTIEIQ